MEMFHPQQNQLGRDDPNVIQPPLIVHLAKLDYALDETTALLNDLEDKLSAVLGDPMPECGEDKPKTYDEGSSEISRRLSGYNARAQNNIVHIRYLMQRLEV